MSKKVTGFAFFSLAFAVGAYAHPDPIGARIESLAGCYMVNIDFREGAAAHDSFNRMKEKVTVTKTGTAYHVKHVTIVDEDAHGEDPIIAHWKPAKGPVVFEHLTEIWQPNSDGSWKQQTLAPHSHSLVYECDGEWIANEFSCGVESVAMMRRDRLKNRTDFATMSILQSILISEDEGDRYSRTLQRNFKRDAQGKVVAVELGRIDYTMLPADKCAAAH